MLKPLNEVIDYDFVEFFQIFIKVIFLVTVILLVLYVYIIHISTDKKMHTYRIILYFNILSCFSLVFIIFLWGPIRLFSTNIIYPVGILSPMPSQVSAIFCVIISLVYDTMGDSFISMFLGSIVN